MFQTLSRELITTTQRIKRNPSNALATTLVMTQAFFITTIFSISLVSGNLLLDYFENKPQVTAFLKDEVTQTQIDEVKEVLTNTGQVDSIKFVSKEEALGIFKEQNKSEPILLEYVTSSILPASLEVSATDVGFLTQIADILTQEKIVDEVIYQKDIVQKLTHFTTLTRNTSIVVVSLFLVTSILIMLIMLGVSISSFKDEIEIMRLVGASSSYIRNPFIFEGILYGLISPLLAVSGVYLLYKYLSPIIQPLFLSIPMFPIPDYVFAYILAGEMIIGVFIGVFTSVVATWKHLKV